MKKFLLSTLIVSFIMACTKPDPMPNTNTQNTANHTCGAKEVHNPMLTYGTVTDIEGNSYKTIQIGT